MSGEEFFFNHAFLHLFERAKVQLFFLIFAFLCNNLRFS